VPELPSVKRLPYINCPKRTVMGEAIRAVRFVARTGGRQPTFPAVMLRVYDAEEAG
jgi:hypothetical protein